MKKVILKFTEEVLCCGEVDMDDSDFDEYQNTISLKVGTDIPKAERDRIFLAIINKYMMLLEEKSEFSIDTDSMSITLI